MSMIGGIGQPPYSPYTTSISSAPPTDSDADGLLAAATGTDDTGTSTAASPAVDATSEQQSAEQFLTQLLASAQAGTGGTAGSGHVHHGGGHHHGGMPIPDSSTDASDSTDATDGADAASTDPLAMLENLLGGGATDDGASGIDMDAALPLDQLTAAGNAYAATGSAGWSQGASLFDTAA